MHIYRKDKRIKHKNDTFQIIVREDNKKGFLKIVDDGKEIKYEYPTAIEFLKLSSFINTDNRIKF